MKAAVKDLAHAVYFILEVENESDYARRPVPRGRLPCRCRVAK